MECGFVCSVCGSVCLASVSCFYPAGIVGRDRFGGDAPRHGSVHLSIMRPPSTLWVGSSEIWGIQTLLRCLDKSDLISCKACSVGWPSLRKPCPMAPSHSKSLSERNSPVFFTLCCLEPCTTPAPKLTHVEHLCMHETLLQVRWTCEFHITVQEF